MSRQAVATFLHKNLALSKTAPKGGGGAPKTLHAAKHHTRVHGRGGDVYFDEGYQLWVEDSTDTPNTLHFFEDEALTIPAGSDITVSDFAARTDVRHLEVLAGPHKGEVLDSVYQLHEDGGGQEDVTGQDAQGHFSYVATWESDGLTTYHERWDFNDGSWLTFLNDPKTGGHHNLRLETSVDVVAVWTFAGDLSGTGTVTGPMDGLPATMVWDATGNGTITWSDQTTEPYNVWS